VRPALVLPLQRGTVLNQTVLPLQQSTGTNPTIGVPRVAHAGSTTGHRSDGITITIATGHRYQSDNWRWAGEAGQRGHVNAPSGSDR
jgi:hypothetical protein